MPRAVSDDARVRLYMPRTNTAIILLLELSAVNLPAVLRFTSDIVNTSHGGNTYMPMQFSVDWAPDDGKTLKETRINIENIDRQAVRMARIATDRPVAVAKFVLSSDTEKVEMGPAKFLLQDMESSLTQVNATAVPHPGMWNVWPQYKRTPQLNEEIYIGVKI